MYVHSIQFGKDVPFGPKNFPSLVQVNGGHMIEFRSHRDLFDESIENFIQRSMLLPNIYDVHSILFGLKNFLKSVQVNGRYDIYVLCLNACTSNKLNTPRSR